MINSVSKITYTCQQQLLRKVNNMPISLLSNTTYPQPLIRESENTGMNEKSSPGARAMTQKRQIILMMRDANQNKFHEISVM